MKTKEQTSRELLIPKCFSVLLIILVVSSGCNLLSGGNGLTKVPETNYFFQLPDNYTMSPIGEGGRLVLREGLGETGTLDPTIWNQESPSIWISTYTFFTSPFQGGQGTFSPDDLFDQTMYPPQIIEHESLEIFIAKMIEQDDSESQVLVQAFIIDGREGLEIHASGNFSDRDKAYQIVLEILNTVIKTGD